MFLYSIESLESTVSYTWPTPTSMIILWKIQNIQGYDKKFIQLCQNAIANSYIKTSVISHKELKRISLIG